MAWLRHLLPRGGRSLRRLGSENLTVARSPLWQAIRSADPFYLPSPSLFLYWLNPPALIPPKTSPFSRYWVNPNDNLVNLEPGLAAYSCYCLKPLRTCRLTGQGRVPARFAGCFQGTDAPLMTPSRVDLDPLFLFLAWCMQLDSESP